MTLSLHAQPKPLLHDDSKRGTGPHPTPALLLWGRPHIPALGVRSGETRPRAAAPHRRGMGRQCLSSPAATTRTCRGGWGGEHRHRVTRQSLDKANRTQLQSGSTRVWGWGPQGRAEGTPS